MVENIKSLALSTKIALNLHALNNEETIGNELKARRVGVVFPDDSDDGKYNIREVNAVSGDMLKRSFLSKFRDLAEEWDLPLSPAAKTLDVERAETSDNFQAALKKNPQQSELYNQLLSCALTDIAGIMLTVKGLSLSRKSVIEFALAPAIPLVDEHYTESLNRLRLPSPAGKSMSDSKPLPFVKPVSSGIYAFIVRVNVNRIGYNDVSQSYPEYINGLPVNRQLRFRALLTALSYSLAEIKGALTSTQLPHRSILDGYFSVSSSQSAPATLLSPLSGADLLTVNEVTARINTLQGYEAVKIYPFSGETELLNRTIEILEHYEPSN